MKLPLHSGRSLLRDRCFMRGTASCRKAVVSKATARSATTLVQATARSATALVQGTARCSRARVSGHRFSGAGEDGLLMRLQPLRSR